jgi:ABC-2 type transport system permease protein
VKVLDIAFKDLLRSFRSAFALVMMFAAPLLITGLIYFAFGGMMGADGGFALPLTPVQIANLDRPNEDGFSLGQMLVEFLQDDELADLLQVTEAPDEASARAAVDNQEAAVAVIIPPDLTAATTAATASTAAQARATITLYPDPTLTLGPAIVQTMLEQIIDGFAGLKIAVAVVTDQLDGRGIAVDDDLASAITMQYATWLQSWGASRTQGAYVALDMQPPPGETEATGAVGAMIGSVMAGMLIFFAFFTGANTAQSIIREDEEGTLARLFTTPTPQALILGGKFTAVFLTIIVQAIVLLLASGIVFGIRWGEPLSVTLVTLGLVVAAAGFGVMLMSFVKTTQQAGSVIGGVLTMVGMAGGLFTTGIPDMPAAFDIVSLFTPHGWALRGLKLALAGGSVGDVLVPVFVLLGLGAAFFTVGALLFRKRFS